MVQSAQVQNMTAIAFGLGNTEDDAGDYIELKCVKHFTFVVLIRSISNGSIFSVNL